IVTMAPGRGATAAQGVAGPFQVKRSFSIINGFAATMTRAQVEALAGSAGVVRIEEDVEVKAFLQDAKNAFGVNRVHAGEDLATPVTGAGTGICIIDTGIDATHTQLDGGKVVAFCDATAGGCGASDPGTTAPYDDHFHGTHVASIAGGDLGVAPGASLYGAKVLNSAGSGPSSQIVAGIEWCAAQAGVNVLNLSLGAVGSGNGTDAMSVAANTASSAPYNKVVAVAAGNNGPGRYEIGPLASADKPIAVGAVADWLSADAGWRKGLVVFSSRGPTADNRIKPDVVAPGVDILAADAHTGSGQTSLSGTSMATPFIAGVAALMLDADGTLLPQQVKDILAATAVRRGDDSTLVPAGTGWPKNIDFGWGEVDAYAAVAEAAGAAGYEPTPFPTQIYEKPTIQDNTVWDFEFEVTDPTTLLSVNVFNGGPWRCTGYINFFGIPLCLGVDAGADFDAELYSPSNALVDMSTCEVDADTQCGALGRQETLLAEPADFAGGQLPLGTWRVRVYPWDGNAFDNKPSESADVIITMGPVGAGDPAPANEPPVAADDSMTVPEGGAQTQLTGGATSVRANDSDTEDALADLAVSLETGPAHGLLTLNADGTFIYTHDGGETTSDSFVYRLTDTDGASDTATVTITINPVNDPPVFTSDPIDGGSVEAGTAYAGTLAGTATDADGDALGYAKVSGPAWLTVAADGTLGGTPVEADEGVNAFGVSVSDGNGGSDSATLNVTVTVTPPPDPDPLVADFTWSPGAPVVGDSVTLTATPGDGDTYEWSISWPGGWKNDPELQQDGTATATFTPKKSGDHVVTLTVTRGAESDSVSETIAVGGGGGGKPCNPNKPGCTGS
ncbi:MAG TPA: S8 family serine peptidase, partial [Alphaproteobacteria bacterium]